VSKIITRCKCGGGQNTRFGAIGLSHGEPISVGLAWEWEVSTMPPVIFRDKAPGQGVRGEALLKLKAIYKRTK